MNMSLPEAALKRIANELPSSDVYSMILINKSFAASTIKSLWHHVALRGKRQINALTRCLKKGGKATFPYGSYVKEMSLYEFNPTMGDYDPTDLEINMNLINSIAPFFPNLASIGLFFGFPDATIGSSSPSPFPFDALASSIPGLEALQVWNSYNPTPSLRNLITNCKNLVRLDVAFFYMDAGVLAHVLEKGKKIRNLHLNAIMGVSNDELVSCLAKAPDQLRELSYRGVQPLTPAHIGQIVRYQHRITYLGIVGSALNAHGLQTLSALPSLKRLELEFSPVDQSVVTETDFINLVTETKSLKHLHLEKPNFYSIDLIQHIVASCPHMDSFSIGLRQDKQQARNLVDEIKAYGHASCDANGLVMFERSKKPLA
ncbi:hypothetical protein SmJEL517_g03007 [Synchytrium microbalum]|uniref:F-box domain-containing protein n=1 Tax=Synchytrium microbalum TaxID=1806994 RepID=A0A507CA36_9FUNG|nr:uncharacterized protein SmJEL517_g03007 [Synchytrium microbalum]TPX34365.1 hypothetical protein SmJEL517_g03007 [Synchytrium microbalum]